MKFRFVTQRVQIPPGQGEPAEPVASLATVSAADRDFFLSALATILHHCDLELARCGA